MMVNIECFVIFRGHKFRPELVMKSIARGAGSGPLSLSLDSHMSSM